MRSARRRAIWGILLGVVFGALGPQLVALSTESRNIVVQEGELPADAPAREDTYTNTFRTAIARWSFSNSDDSRVSYEFVAAIGAHHSSSSDGRAYGAAATEERRASAVIWTCPADGECKLKLWTGADELRFDHAPYSAHFAGTLLDEDGRACTFDVRWTPTGPPVPGSPQKPADRPHHEAQASVSERAGEQATAALTSSCWGPLGAEGFNGGSVYVEATADAGASRSQP